FSASRKHREIGYRLNPETLRHAGAKRHEVCDTVNELGSAAARGLASLNEGKPPAPSRRDLEALWLKRVNLARDRYKCPSAGIRDASGVHARSGNLHRSRYQGKSAYGGCGLMI